MKYLLIFCIFIQLFSLNTWAQTSTRETPLPLPPSAETTVNPATTSSPSSISPSKEPQTSVNNTRTEAASPYAAKDAPVRIPRFETPPVIDGQINQNEWASTVMFGEFLQTQPGDNVAPTQPTEVMMGYDAKNLYVAFRVKQDRDKVRATIARRDNIFNDDYIGVYLDTFNDQRCCGRKDYLHI